MKDTLQSSEQPPLLPDGTASEPAYSFLDRWLARVWSWDWEKIAWAGLLIVAAVVRLVDLGNRTMSHDESEHAWFAYNLVAGKGYEHSPVYHGPFAYHVLALFYLIFGDSTVMARVPTALFGIGIVLLMWPLRRWIGKAGAFLAAVMVTMSPALLQYARHTRHDTYEIFWALVLIIAVFRYLETGKPGAGEAGGFRPPRWIYLVAAALSFMLAIKEVAFIYGAAVGGFLVLLVLFRWIGWRLEPGYPEEEREAPLRIGRRDWLVLAAAVLVSLAGTLLFRLLGLADRTDQGGMVLLSMILIVLPPLVAVLLAYWRQDQRQDGDEPPPHFGIATDLTIVLGTLILPWLSPLAIQALGYDPLNYTFPAGVLPSLSVLVATFGIAIAVGILWNVRRWLIAAGIFAAIFVFFFTTMFTNGKGIATGLVGSLGYWLSQQEVARGGQPWYYYLLIVPLYEFLPIVLSLPVVLAALFRRNRISLLLLAVVVVALVLWLVLGATAGQEPATLVRLAGEVVRLVALSGLLLAVSWGALSARPQRERYFLAFLPFWILLNWIAYTAAGEKMPWLTTHITLPMCIAGGWWLGRVVQRVDWQAARQRGGVWIALLIVPLLAAILALLATRPFRSRTIEGISESTQWVVALVALVAILYLMARVARRLGVRQTLRIAGLTVVLLLGIWTVRTSYMLNFINQDYTSEFLFYAHGTPDPAMDMQDIESISRRTVGDKQLKVAYDDDASWPFNWYLRDWPNAVYFGANPTREALLDAEVAIVGSKNLDKARPYLQRDFYEFDHRLIWWPDEGYRDTSLEKIWRGVTDPEKRKEFLNVVLWRKYPTPMNRWPLVHRYSFFVRKDLAARLWDFGTEPTQVAAVADPYEAGFREVSALTTIGSGPGSETGQLNFPRNMAVAADGTVFVADSGNHRIQAFAPDGTYLRTWGSTCELYTEGNPGCVDPDGDGPLQLGDGQMREPWGIAIGTQGNVYVADTWNHRIQVFDPQGNFLAKWGTFVTTDGEAVGSPGGFWGPRAIAIDAAGNLYVTDTGNKRIQAFTPEGDFLGQFGGGGVTEGRFDEPVGLAILPRENGEPGGTLFVADTWNRRVQVVDVSFTDGTPTFVYLREWNVEGWSSQSVVNKPYLAVSGPPGEPETVGGDVKVYVTDPENWRVLVFDGDGQFGATFGLFGTDDQSFALPVGVATGPDGNVYVADSDNHRVMVFPPVE